MALALGGLLGAAGRIDASGSDPCRASPGAPRLDHVVVVVRDLDAAAKSFGDLGFRFKPGRLHANNLRNRHIKFRNGTELELMTLAGPPKDRMAQDYAQLLEAGPGGAYVALSARDLDALAATAERVGLTTRRTTAGSWQFLSFPGLPDAAAVFFGSGWVPPADPDSVFAHSNGAIGLEEAWLEAGPGFDRLLQASGAAPCGSVTLPNERQGERWALGSGTLVVVRPRLPGAVPRVLGVGLTAKERAAAGPAEVEPMPGLWLAWRNEPPSRER